MSISFNLFSISLIIFCINFKLLKCQICNNNEVYFNKFCYNLLTFQELSNTPITQNACNSTNQNTRCSQYLDQIVIQLANIYTNNLKLTNVYEFATLDIKRQKHVFEHLIEKNLGAVKKTVFLNSYFFNHNVYFENQPSEGEMPNVVLHSDNSDNSEVKCIYG